MPIALLMTGSTNWVDAEIQQVTAYHHRLECLETGRESPPNQPDQDEDDSSSAAAVEARVTEVRESETTAVPLNDSCEVMSGALMVSCRSAEFNVADIAVQGDSLAETVTATMRLLDRMKIVGRDGSLYTVTYLNTTTGRDLNGDAVPTGVTLRVERVPAADGGATQ